MPVILHGAPPDDLTADEVARWRAVPTAVAADVAAGRGLVDPAIRPLCPPGRQARLSGRAVTVRCDPPDFGAVPLAVDRAGPGDVLVIAAGGQAGTAMIGEILGGHLRRRGGVGLVCDGAIRDVAELAGFAGFAVFARHTTPRGPSSAEGGEIGAPVAVGGVAVHPGDLVIGDDDGLMVLRPGMARALIAAAEAKLAREAGWQADLAAGRSLAEALGLPGPIPPGSR